MAVTYSQNGTIVRTVMPTDAVSTRRIDSEQGINVVDENGYIGAVVTDYFPHTGNTYYNNFAIVINHADFSQSGLGQVTFITPGTADIGNRTYRTVTIGTQTWLAENLDYKFSGCDIGPTGAPTTPAAWYYDNDETTYGINGYNCGLLYNAYAIMHLNNNRNVLCPGWHVPTEGEWNTLVSYIGGSTPGAALKALDGSIGGTWPSNWNGVDNYLFSILPTGYRRENGTFEYIGSEAKIYTSSINDNKYLFTREFTRNSGTVERSWVFYACGCPTRLIKDAT